MAKKKYTVIIEKDESGYYVAEVVELPGCFTQARTLDEIEDRIKEAIEGYLLVKKERPMIKFVGIQQVEVNVKA